MTRLERLRAYPAHADPRAAACNMIALVVAWNQPLYPLYVRWLVGGDAWATCWTFLSTPFFLAVPFVARRNALAGRALLPLAGVANTVLSAKAFGLASGVAWFLVPCGLIALLAFRPREWRVTLALGVVLSATALVLPHLGLPLGAFTFDQYRAFARLNGWSVLALSVVVLWSLGRAAWRDQVAPAKRVATR
jgi:hypothetical protein